MKFKNVHEATLRRLCVGCGACSSVCPEGKVTLVDVEDDGIRPFVDSNACHSCETCLSVCPGIQTPQLNERTDSKTDAGSARRWGSFLEIWEGYAADPEIRLKGSSGGLCTALSLFCLENGVAEGVVHTGNSPGKPWKNQTVYSKSREALLKRTGSRYSPASPCDGFKYIESAENPSVFIGKPCDIEALRLAQDLRPELKAKTSLTVGFFCAGTPSTKGTLDFFRSYAIDPNEVEDFRYRGSGWPGMATITFKDGNKPPIEITYQDSWGFVNAYRPFRCYLCPDLTAEFADISVGDPWYRKIGEDEPGRSLILIRTEKGRTIFQQAMEAGYVTAEMADPDIIYRSQKNLLTKRQAIWGRLVAMKMMGIPTPHLEGFHLFDNWLDLPAKEKLKSVLGTVRRIVQRNYFKPLDHSKYLERIEKADEVK